MYTIRHILGQALGLTKSGVRWDIISDISGKYTADKNNKITATEVISSKQTAAQIRTDLSTLEFALEQADTKDDLLLKAKYSEIIKALTEGLKTNETQARDAMVNAVPPTMPDTTVNGGIKPLPTNLKNAAKLSEGSAYNNIDTASALVFLRTILNTQDTADVRDLISSTLNLQVRDGNKDDAVTDASANRATLKAALLKFGYVFGASKWEDKEVSDLKDFLEDHLGKEGYKSLRDTGSVKVDVKKTALDKYKWVEVINSMVVQPAKVGDIKSLLQNIADIGGVDQGQKPDGILRSDNSKNYSGLLSRLFTNGEWAQAGVISEMSFYRELEMRITSVEQLKAIMIDVIDDKVKVDAVFDGKGDFATKFRDIVPLFSRASLVRVAAVQYAGAAGMSDKEYITATDKRTDINIAKQAESAAKQAEILSAVSALPGVQNWTKWLRAQGIPADVINKTLSTISNIWLGGFRANFGINVETTVTETFTEWIKRNNHTQKVVNHLGQVVSSTVIQTITGSGTDKTTDTAKKLLPVLNIGFDIAKVKWRVSEDLGVHAQAGIDAYAGINGLKIPMSIGGGATYTAIDNNSNAPLSADIGNVTLGAGVNIGIDLLKQDIRGLTLYINLLWNDRIDAIERAGYQHKAILGNIFDDKRMIKAGGFDTAKKAIDAKRGALKDPTATQTLELDMLTSNIRLLEKIQDSSLSPEKKLMATAKFLEATVSDHEFIQKAKNSGVHVAGVTDTFSFLTGLMSIGINIQNINAAYIGKTTTEDALSRAEQTTLSYIDTTLQDSQKRYISNEIVVNENTGAITTKRADAFAQVSAPGITVVGNTDGTSTLTPPAGQKLQLSMLDSRKGALSYKILVAKTIAMTPSVAPTAVTASVDTAPAPVVPVSDTTPASRDALADRATVEAYRVEMYKLSRSAGKGSPFDRALQAIGDQDYTTALTLLQGMKNKRVTGFLNAIGNDPARLTVLTTQSYTDTLKGKTTVTAKEYPAARKASIPGEKLLSGNPADFDINEKLLTTDHTATPLSKTYLGQDVSTSIYATPAYGTTPRIDKSNGSITTSDKMVSITDSIHQDLLLSQHSAEIERHRVELNKFMNTTKKTTGIEYVSVVQYMSILRTGKVDNIPGLSITAGADKPAFFETRAMVNHSGCMNKVDGIAYTRFACVPTATPTNPNPGPVTQPPSNQPAIEGGEGTDALHDPNTSMNTTQMWVGVVGTRNTNTVNKKNPTTTTSEGTTVLPAPVVVPPPSETKPIPVEPVEPVKPPKTPVPPETGF